MAKKVSFKKEVQGNAESLNKLIEEAAEGIPETFEELKESIQKQIERRTKEYEKNKQIQEETAEEDPEYSNSFKTVKKDIKKIILHLSAMSSRVDEAQNLFKELQILYAVIPNLLQAIAEEQQIPLFIIMSIHDSNKTYEELQKEFDVDINIIKQIKDVPIGGAEQGFVMTLGTMTLEERDELKELEDYYEDIQKEEAEGMTPEIQAFLRASEILEADLENQRREEELSHKKFIRNSLLALKKKFMLRLTNAIIERKNKHEKEEDLIINILSNIIQAIKYDQENQKIIDKMKK